MKISSRTIPRLTYRLRLDAQMKLSLRLLQMPLPKLNVTIKQNVQENPLLDAEDPKTQTTKEEAFDDFLSQDAPGRFGADSPYADGDDERKRYGQTLLAYPTTLSEHLLRQFHLFVTDDLERRIGEGIIAHIDDNGYVTSPLKDIAKGLGVPVAAVKKVLLLIQGADPVGVGARDLRECLLLQLKSRHKKATLSYSIVDKYLSCLEKRRYKHIAVNLKVPVERVREAAKDIARLEPKPGRSFNAEKTVALIPEAFLTKDPKGYSVVLNDGEVPQLTLNKKYRDMIRRKDTPEDVRRYLRERLHAAKNLMAAVAQRQTTVYKVIETIVSAQKRFLDKGESYLKPQTLEEIAKKTGKSKSTVSRTINNKYLQTRWGLIELRYFLSSKIRQKNGRYVSSKAIKSKIADLISREEPHQPLCDRRIVELLKKDGVSVARRTVAKYRAQLKILSSPSRQE